MNPPLGGTRLLLKPHSCTGSSIPWGMSWGKGEVVEAQLAQGC